MEKGMKSKRQEGEAQLPKLIMRAYIPLSNCRKSILKTFQTLVSNEGLSRYFKKGLPKDNEGNDYSESKFIEHVE